MNIKRTHESHDIFDEFVGHNFMNKIVKAQYWMNPSVIDFNTSYYDSDTGTTIGYISGDIIGAKIMCPISNGNLIHLSLIDFDFVSDEVPEDELILFRIQYGIN